MKSRWTPKAQLGAFVANAPVAMAVFDMDMRYIAVSERWMKDSRLDRSPVGLLHYDAVPEIPAAWRDVHSRCLAGACESSDGEPFHHPDGRVEWVKWAACPWRDDEGRIGGIILTIEDVTLRKEAEAEAAHFASVVKDSSEAIVSKTLDLNVTSWNAGATRLLGYSSEEMIGQPIARVIPPDRLGEEDQFLSRLRAGEAIENFETKRVARDGSVLDVSLSISPMRNALAAIVGASAIMRDVTARNRQDKALRRSEEQLRLALQGAQAAAWRLNIVTCELECSPEAYMLHGRDPERVTASYEEWLASVHPEDLAGVVAAVKDALEKRTSEIKLEYRVALPSGEIRWLAGLGKMEFANDGTPLQTSGIHLDITDRKRAELSALASEAARRQSERRLRHAVDAGQLTYAEFDLRSGLARAAENYGRVMGYAPLRQDGVLDVASALARLVAHVAPEDRAGVGEKLRSALSGEFPVVEAEFRVVGDDGAIRWIRSVGEADLGANGLPERIFVTNLDVTPQVEAREALNRAREEAERANQAKSKFLATASHDLRQPVQSLVLQMALAERQIAGNPQALETLERMRGSLEGLNGLLNAILDISRFDAGVEAKLEAVDLGVLLRRLELEYRPKAEGLGLALKIVPRELWATADPALLERALRNLIENALRYTPGGGVLIGPRRRADRVRIDVVDTGIGVPPNRREDIFEEFVQINNPGRQLGLGLGLGLAIVARIAALIDATIEVNSREGKGSRFSLTLPAAEPAPGLIDESGEDLEDPGGRILIVEDNATVRDELEALLTQWGYETVAASDGEQALDLAERDGWRFGCIVTDQRLGAGRTGVETAKEIQRRSNRALPTLVLTGDTATENIAQIVASGFQLLYKPIATAPLRRVVARMMVA